MTVTLDFDESFTLLKRTMTINLCHPDLVKDIKWFIGFLIRHSLYTIIFVLATYNIVASKTNSFTQVCENGVVAVMYIETTCFFAVVLSYKNKLKHLIGVMKDDYNYAKQLSEEEQKVVLTYIEKGQWISRTWGLIVYTGFTIFVLRSVVLTIYYSWGGELRLVEFYQLIYPEFVQKNEHVHIIFFIKYAITAYFAGYGSTMYTACSPLGPLFMLHACGQLELLKIRINVLYEGRTKEQVQQELNDIAKRMQFIYGFIEEIMKCFRACYDVILKAASVLIPITFYEFLASLKRGELALEYGAFIIGSVLQSSSPCYYSDLLMTKGEEVCMALYMCGWEREYDRRVRSSLVIMLTRALRPTAIRTLFRTISLEALTDVFQQAYAIFNLINTVWN